MNVAEPLLTPDPATTPWVPLGPPVPGTGGGDGGSSVAYVGAYDPAHVYESGEYVVGADGITYQCVIDGTTGVAPAPWATPIMGVPQPVVNGQWLKGVGGAAQWQPITTADVGLPHVSYGTSPPASPVDGDVWFLPVAAGELWQFRYNAASSTGYPWEFVGGAIIYRQEPYGAQSAADANWHPAAGNARFTVPRAGTYQCRASMLMQISDQGQFALGVWGLGQSPVDPVAYLTTTAPMHTGGYMFQTTPVCELAVGVPAGETLTPWLYASTPAAFGGNRVWLSVTPRCVA